jgi:hypothetical protein
MSDRYESGAALGDITSLVTGLRKIATQAADRGDLRSHMILDNLALLLESAFDQPSRGDAWPRNLVGSA